VQGSGLRRGPFALLEEDDFIADQLAMADKEKFLPAEYGI
jgi:hypothetical protein